jgi:hypothetical protein
MNQQLTDNTGAWAMLTGLGIFAIIPIMVMIVWTLFPFIMWVKFNAVLRQLHAIRWLTSEQNKHMLPPKQTPPPVQQKNWRWLFSCIAVFAVISASSAFAEPPTDEDFAQYRKEIAETLATFTECAKRGAAFRNDQAERIMQHGVELAALENDPDQTTRFWDAAIVLLKRGVPARETVEMVKVCADAWLAGTDGTQTAEESALIFGDWDDHRRVGDLLPRIIGDAVFGNRAAAQQLQIELRDLHDMQARLERIWKIMTIRFHARAELERAKAMRIP